VSIYLSIFCEVDKLQLKYSAYNTREYCTHTRKRERDKTSWCFFSPRNGKNSTAAEAEVVVAI